MSLRVEMSLEMSLGMALGLERSRPEGEGAGTVPALGSFRNRS